MQKEMEKSFDNDEIQKSLKEIQKELREQRDRFKSQGEHLKFVREELSSLRTQVASLKEIQNKVERESNSFWNLPFFGWLNFGSERTRSTEEDQKIECKI